MDNFQGKLMTVTQELLEKHDEDIFKIAVNTGLPYYWLRSFKTKRNKEPGVNKVEQLYTYLSGKQLEV